MHRREFLKATGVTLSSIGIAGCTSQNRSGGQRPDGSVAMGRADGSYYFDPIGLFVEPGETVTWVIENGIHTTTAYAKENGSVTRIPDGAASWDSEFLSQQGATFEHTFEVKGTHDYYCTPHKSFGMIGRIVVGEPGGPAEGRMPPNGTLPESSTIVEQNSISHDEFTN